MTDGLSFRSNAALWGMKIEVVEDPTMQPDVIRLVYKRPLTPEEQKKLVDDFVAEFNRMTGPQEGRAI